MGAGESVTGVSPSDLIGFKMDENYMMPKIYLITSGQDAFLKRAFGAYP